MQINFEVFLTTFRDTLLWQKYAVIAFLSPEIYPFLFINRCIKYLTTHKIIPYPLKTLTPPLTSHEMKDYVKTLPSKLSVSFLGETHFYFLGNLSLLNEKDQKTVLTFLKSYQGPHVLCFFLLTNTPQDDTWLQINVPSTLNEKLFQSTYHALGLDSVTAYNATLMHTFFKKTEYLSLDESCMLLEYAQTFSSKQHHAYLEHVLRTLSQEKPLTLLADYFFAKKSDDFFTLWYEVRTMYPPIFWVSFWAEHLWRAYFFAYYMHQKNYALAKKIGFRLPFSFTKSGWHVFSLQELSQGYTFVYTTDFMLKQGSLFCSLDLFYCNHFLGTFSSEG